MTLTKRVIPCLDVKDGRVVKGVQFENLRDVGDPAQLATRYEQEGADEIVFLDISASREGRATLLDVVRRTAERLFIPLTVGGGIGSVEDVHAVLRAGADKVSINTAAVRRPEVVTEASEQFGAQCIVASVDARRTSGPPVGQDAGPEAEVDWRCYTHGGSKATELEAVAWCQELARRGAGEVLLTSMDCDGTQDGYDLLLTRRVVDAVGVPVIASGGAGTLDHLLEAVTAGGADAALAASIFHDGIYSVLEAKEHLAGAGLEVRMDLG